jgi:2-iminoacetate synthase ThiH
MLQKEGQEQMSKLHIKLAIGHKETEKGKELNNYIKNLNINISNTCECGEQ